jgi:hypothetical protein
MMMMDSPSSSPDEYRDSASPMSEEIKCGPDDLSATPSMVVNNNNNNNNSRNFDAGASLVLNSLVNNEAMKGLLEQQQQPHSGIFPLQPMSLSTPNRNEIMKKLKSKTQTPELSWNGISGSSTLSNSAKSEPNASFNGLLADQWLMNWLTNNPMSDAKDKGAMLAAALAAATQVENMALNNNNGTPSGRMSNAVQSKKPRISRKSKSPGGAKKFGSMGDLPSGMGMKLNSSIEAGKVSV